MFDYKCRIKGGGVVAGVFCLLWPNSSPQLNLVALNQPHTGDMMGLDVADRMCYEQAKAMGLPPNYRAFISSHRQDLVHVVYPGFRETLPITNLRVGGPPMLPAPSFFPPTNQPLFPLSGRRDVPELAFHIQRQRRADQSQVAHLLLWWPRCFSGPLLVSDSSGQWFFVCLFHSFTIFFSRFRPQKSIWHGSTSTGMRVMDKHCETWRADHMSVVGQSSSLASGLLLGQETRSCSNQYIVLCIETHKNLWTSSGPLHCRN